ncbi:MAG: ankyrin repeat domain-containing protein [Proteobacteria bacterium]|nr:ankyrin repeat domain-containing protein [Pseudomonadota bacterium]
MWNFIAHPIETIAKGINATFGYKDEEFLAKTKNGELNSVTQLLNEGANLECVDTDQNTPLLIAVWQNHEELVKFFIKQKANLLAQDKHSRTALEIAAFKGYINIVKVLLENDNSKQAKLKGILAAIKGEQMPAIGLLVDNNNFKEALEYAIEHSKHISLQSILSQRPLEVEYVNELLGKALKKNDVRAIQILLPYANLDKDATVLFNAAEKGHTEITLYLLGATYIKNAQNDVGNLIHVAVNNNHFDLMTALLNTKLINPYEVNSRGETPYQMLEKKLARLKVDLKKQQSNNNNALFKAFVNEYQQMKHVSVFDYQSPAEREQIARTNVNTAIDILRNSEYSIQTQIEKIELMLNWLSKAEQEVRKATTNSSSFSAIATLPVPYAYPPAPATFGYYTHNLSIPEPSAPSIDLVSSSNTEAILHGYNAQAQEITNDNRKRPHEETSNEEPPNKKPKLAPGKIYPSND